MKRYQVALTIAGSDSGGGAGIQADLKTFSSLGVFGTSVITSITAQNTQEVRAVEVLPVDIIKKQIEAVFDDIKVDAVKTGMLPTPEIIELFAAMIDKYHMQNIIVDPVMVATTGARLSSAKTVEYFKKDLFSRITLITPNIPEAEALSGISISNEADMHKAGEKILADGCNAVLVKGGHLKNEKATDILFRKGKEPIIFSAEKIETKNVHGTGCTMSSAIAAYMAMGEPLEIAVMEAKNYISDVILFGSDIILGKGSGPVNHFYNPQRLKTVE